MASNSSFCDWSLSQLSREELNQPHPIISSAAGVFGLFSVHARGTWEEHAFTETETFP